MIPGTFEWYKHQKKNTDSNYMGKSQKITKLEKKPAPNHYNLNTNWSKKENIMNMTTMPSAQKSVYYHWFYFYIAENLYYISITSHTLTSIQTPTIQTVHFSLQLCTQSPEKYFNFSFTFTVFDHPKFIFI